ncbi:MAG: hypothetical protein KFB93_04010 [Simkaniaceae bacterium]|nr:MAG: hypothetical protein KFB93_04010 [Simkaniaceae bacterium]
MGNIDPIPDYQMPGTTPKATVSSAGQQTFQAQAEAFYSWYQSIRQPTSPSDGYRGLQYIMQIGEKGTATQEEGNLACEELKALMEDLDGGRKTLDQIPYEIGRIVDHLTETNPKSRIVMQATQVEIAVNLSQLDNPDEFRDMMKSLLQKVNPEMPNIQAEAISHALQEGLDQQKVNAGDLKGKIFSLLK